MNTKITTKQERIVRDAIIEVCRRINSAALHLSSVANSKDWRTCWRALSNEEFVAITGISKDAWEKVVATQNGGWLLYVQADFDLKYEMQLNVVDQITNK